VEERERDKVRESERQRQRGRKDESETAEAAVEERELRVGEKAAELEQEARAQPPDICDRLSPGVRLHGGVV
jgi:hypothetical protein